MRILELCFLLEIMPSKSNPRRDVFRSKVWTLEISFGEQGNYFNQLSPVLSHLSFFSLRCLEDAMSSLSSPFISLFHHLLHVISCHIYLLHETNKSLAELVSTNFIILILGSRWVDQIPLKQSIKNILNS